MRLMSENITYFVSMDQIRAIKKDSSRCEQHIRVECVQATAYDGAYWMNIDMERENYEYAKKVGDPPCKCRFRTGACDETGLSR